MAVTVDGEAYVWGDCRHLFDLNKFVESPVKVNLPDIFNFSNDPKVNKAHVKETLNIDLTDGLTIYGYSKPKRKILT